MSSCFWFLVFIFLEELILLSTHLHLFLAFIVIGLTLLVFLVGCLFYCYLSVCGVVHSHDSRSHTRRISRWRLILPQARRFKVERSQGML